MPQLMNSNSLISEKLVQQRRGLTALLADAAPSSNGARPGSSP